MTNYFLAHPAHSMTVAVFSEIGSDKMMESATLGVATMIYKSEMTKPEARKVYRQLTSEGWAKATPDKSGKFTHEYVWEVYA